MATSPSIREPVTALRRAPSISEPVEVEPPGKTKPATTTIEITVEVKEQLEAMKVDSREAIARTIERMLDEKVAESTPNGMVNILIPRNKYDWLLLKQNNLDCVHMLKGYVKV